MTGSDKDVGEDGVEFVGVDEGETCGVDDIDVFAVTSESEDVVRIGGVEEGIDTIG